MTDAELIKRAQAMYASDDIEIDDDAKVSNSDLGVFVQAWVWVPYPEPEAQYPDQTHPTPEEN